MHRFYVNQDQIITDTVTVIGSDVNHIKNVLRMKQGDEILICNGQGKDYYCIINRVSDNEITAKINAIKDTEAELKSKITLYQGIPKKDKFELIIQKAVELGVYEIVPVMTERVVVKLEDAKKEEKKLERWQTIAREAAKQSGRGLIPVIKPVHSFSAAIKAMSEMNLALIPYEKAGDMNHTRDLLRELSHYSSIGVFIGPEGGFDDEEIGQAIQNNIKPITLGRRILRTETAGLAILSMMVLMLEE